MKVRCERCFKELKFDESKLDGSDLDMIGIGRCEFYCEECDRERKREERKK